ncbi:glycosyltransferase family 2 protein [Dietzia sp. B32]|uniref:glycosyltransferase family 2 protein n=1 Tax=Dietzia sp. B32 TaxID=2915130 RepID=UPI0021ADE5EC|nr:glycosyltransferase [Dietzia sp. B32]UVE94086.1 glycosyltransferase [Dietzia sp. B32]
MTAARTTVVVCANSSDRYPQLVAAVGSVLEQSRPPAEVIMVIDHNPDLLGRVTRRFPDLVAVENSGPQGLSGARNTGTARARGDIVAFLDDDAEADPGWLEAMTAHFARPEVLGVSGFAEPQWAVGRPGWWPDEFDWVVGCSYRGLPLRPEPVRNLMGCAMALRRDVVRAAGGFDTALGRTRSGAAGCEETELCIRAAGIFPGGVFLHEPAARVRHHVPASRGTLGYFRSRCFAEGVSKRLVTRRTGAGNGLASEYTYTTRTLPAGVVRNLARALRGDPAGVLRAAAIGYGLGATMAGFLTAPGRRTRTPGASAVLPTVDPVLPLVIDVCEPPRPLRTGSDHGPYQRAWCLLLDDGIPVSEHEIPLDGTEETTADLLGRLERTGAGGAGRRTRSAGRGRTRDDTTVVIATRGRPALLAECLESIAGGTTVPSRVVVVDNARPDDETEQLVTRYRMPGSEVAYVREDRPGLALAHNAALPHVATGLVAFTDDDVWVHDRWLENITSAFDADPDTVCVTGMIAPRELDTLAQQWVEAQGVYSKGFRSRVFDNAEHRGDNPMFPYAAGTFGSGANMAFRTDFLRTIGGFDGALGTGTVTKGGDDLAVFYDVIRHGGRLTYVPSAIVLHPHHRDYAALRRQVYGYGAGLGAHLTRCVLDEPRAVVTMLRNHRAATARLATILHPPRSRGLPAYPRDLSRAQRSGLASGPARYLLSRYGSRGPSERRVSA